MAKLTDKQILFCKEYVVDFNATQAAIRSGYSKKTAGRIGSENLQKLGICERVREEIGDRFESVELTADWVLDRLKQLVERCMQAEPVMVRDADGQMVESGEYKFDSAGANSALDKLGKYLQMFVEKKEIKVDANMTVVGLDDWRDQGDA